MHQPLTPAACRVLDQATNFASSALAEFVEPEHLLRALVFEESRASEMLLDFGIDAARLKQWTDADVDARGAEEDPVPFSATVKSVVHEAQLFAGSQWEHADVGTEHLLWGLIVVECEPAVWLRREGVSRDRLAELLDDRSNQSDEPLQTDVRISLREPLRSEHHDAYRIIDAAANRAREGIRVVEDYVRFSLDDAHLTELLKNWRHDFSAAIAKCGSRKLTAARETSRDVGTPLTTEAETRRESLRHLVQANFKRGQEALRTLEEAGKLLTSDLGREFEQLRYRLYTIEKAAVTAMHCNEVLAGRNLYLLLTESLCHHGSGPAVRGALAGGVSIVQLREKEMDDRRLLEFGHRVRAWTREAGALFIFNDRPDLAVLTGADGVHVGQEELSVKDARRIVGVDKLVGVSTHTIEQARQAVVDGADYIGVGPVFPSTTKPFEEYAGLEFVKQVAAEVTLPFYAIGGINADNIAQVRQAGCTRVAVTGAVCSQADPQAAAAELLEKLSGETSGV